MARFREILIILLFILFQFLISAAGNIPAMSAQEDSGDSSVVAEIEQEFGVVTDPAIVARIDAVKNRLLEVISEAKTDEREIIVKVLDEDNVNAFALPGGHVYIFRGLLEECETDDMLAGVMAHEFAHIFHRHHSAMGERQIRGMLIGIAAVIITGEGEAAILGQMLAASMVETYGRNAENDADRTGTEWTVLAGYDPVGFLELMQILEQESIHQPEPGGNYFTIHPNPEERMTNIRETLSEMGIEIPEDIYRVHLLVRLYLPLTEDEAAALEQWEAAFTERAEGRGNAASDAHSDKTDDDIEEEIPLSMFNEYRFRQQIFENIDSSTGRAYGAVTVGGQPVFYIAGESIDDVTSRGNNIVSKLGDKMLNGLRNYEVQGRIIDGAAALIANRRIIAYTTAADAELLGLTPEEANTNRVQLLKDILYRYFVNRRI